MALQRFQHFIGGDFCNAAESFESIAPSTEQPWAVMPAASAAYVNRAVQAAYRALLTPEWADMTATAWGKLLMRLGDLVAEHADRLAELETRAQIGYVADYYRYFGGLADKLQGACLPVDRTDMNVTVRREPIGVVAGIFAASGQSWVAGSRLYVERSAYGRLLDILKGKAERIVIGDPQDVRTEMGPLATRRQRDGIRCSGHHTRAVNSRE